MYHCTYLENDRSTIEVYIKFTAINNIVMNSWNIISKYIFLSQSKQHSTLPNIYYIYTPYSNVKRVFDIIKIRDNRYRKCI